MSAADVPRLTGLLETALYVADLARSAAFYQGLFGFETFLEQDRMRALGVGTAQVLLLFRHGGSVEPTETPAGVIPAHDGHGRLHLCFAIPSDAVSGWEARLERLGVALESRVTWPRGSVSLYFRDPDGHSVELATPGLWPNY